MNRQTVKIALAVIVMIYLLGLCIFAMHSLYSMEATVVDHVAGTVQTTNKLYVIIAGHIATGTLTLVPFMHLYFYVIETLKQTRG